MFKGAFFWGGCLVFVFFFWGGGRDVMSFVFSIWKVFLFETILYFLWFNFFLFGELWMLMRTSIQKPQAAEELSLEEPQVPAESLPSACVVQQNW